MLTHSTGLKTKMAMFNVTAPRQLSAENISDLVIAALEGGSNYWLARIRVRAEGNTDDIRSPVFWENNDGSQLKDEGFWDNLTSVAIVIELSEEEEGDEKVEIVVTHASVEEALSKMYGRRGGFDMENYDAEDADCFLQRLLLGDVVYG